MNTDSLHDNTPIANLCHNIQTLTEPYDDNNMNSSIFRATHCPRGPLGQAGAQGLATVTSPSLTCPPPPQATAVSTVNTPPEARGKS